MLLRWRINKHGLGLKEGPAETPTRGGRNWWMYGIELRGSDLSIGMYQFWIYDTCWNICRFSRYCLGDLLSLQQTKLYYYFVQQILLLRTGYPVALTGCQGFN